MGGRIRTGHAVLSATEQRAALGHPGEDRLLLCAAYIVLLKSIVTFP